jgi:hypothetical protein
VKFGNSDFSAKAKPQEIWEINVNLIRQIKFQVSGCRSVRQFAVVLALVASLSVPATATAGGGAYTRRLDKATAWFIDTVGSLVGRRPKTRQDAQEFLKKYKEDIRGKEKIAPPKSKVPDDGATTGLGFTIDVAAASDKPVLKIVNNVPRIFRGDVSRAVYNALNPDPRLTDDLVKSLQTKPYEFEAVRYTTTKRAKDIDPYQSPPDGWGNRYTPPGGKSIYWGQGLEEVLAEAHKYGDAVIGPDGKLALNPGLVLQHCKIQLDNVVDLSDAATQNALKKAGISVDDLIVADDYRLTQELGMKLRELGVNGIVFPSATSNLRPHVVIFDYSAMPTPH